ncbi:MAG TPA: hypothetical protein VNM92_17900 [Thermoanaerobaculia bacterium]|nr:hypothetical protein [Thermoanaerobaculia bacterium]
MKPLDTTPEKVLREAILSEASTHVYYEKLAERAATADVRNRLLALSAGKLRHRSGLEQKYREEIGTPPPDPASITIELPAELRTIDMGRALKIALEHEREKESNFRFLAERVPGTELGALFMELAEIAWKHKVALQNEYDLTVADPEEFLLDI